MIVATLATIPGRKRAAREAADSLRRQVDSVLIYDNALQIDRGDAGKFACAPESGYHVVCDDDLIYHDGYVDMMIAAVERYRREAVIVLQGRRLHRALSSYYGDRAGQTKFTFFDPLKEDEHVTVGGTGVMVYHTDTIRFSLKDFPYRNAADVQAAWKCAREGVPIVCAAHTGREVSMSKNVDHMKHSIWAQTRKNDAIPTSLVNRVFAMAEAA